MKPAIDLVLGRPRVVLSASRLLVGEVTTPYGVLPTEELVESTWRGLAGERAHAPWLLLGRRDTPSGTIWGLAWCPPVGALPDAAEIVLPEALWALECMNGTPGPEGWHVRRLESPQGVWTGLWEGARCEHLSPPVREAAAALELERTLAGQRGATEVPQLEFAWSPPSPEALRELSESRPEADLLGLTESVLRGERRADRTSIARTAAILLVLGAITGAFGIHQAWHAHQRRLQESRLESVRTLVDRAAHLESSRGRQIDSLRRIRDALSRSQAPDLVLRAIAAKVPPSIRLQVLAMEGATGTWRIRAEARLPDWNAVEPFTRDLRSLPRVSKVSVANQSRQSDAVAAILEIEGTWP